MMDVLRDRDGGRQTAAPGRSSALMSGSVRELYATRVASGDIEPDPGQESVAVRLAQLQAQLSPSWQPRIWSRLARLFRNTNSTAGGRGIYIHGDVGRGKTMLMDLFFASAAERRKRRTHFHEFMADVHDRIYAARRDEKAERTSAGDPIGRVAAGLATESRLICFDEFHVTDIADAMILGRLFRSLFELGVLIVATSNLAPRELYKDGLNRDLFLPFIALVEARMTVIELKARADFRLEKLRGAPVWHVLEDEAAARALDETWRQLTVGHPAGPRDLPVKGRILRVRSASMGVARFSFSDLCDQPLAAADYLRIAQEFHTVLLEHIPIMDHDRRDAAKRFIVLIDTLYEHGVKLVASAAAEPDALYLGTEGFEVGEFKRASSRLIEMRSQPYLARAHGAGHVVAAASRSGLVET